MLVFFMVELSLWLQIFDRAEVELFWKVTIQTDACF